jgi:dienelactone hydrolase
MRTLVQQRSIRDHRTVPHHAVGPSSARVRATPEVGLSDEPLDLVVEGLAPRGVTEVTGRVILPSGSRWTSRAVYVSDGDGRVDLSRDAPIAGTFLTPDPDGLIWSLRHDPTSPPRAGGKRFLHEGLEPYTLELRVRTEAGDVASAEVRRLATAPGVERIEVREDGLVGTLFLPAAETTPTIVVNLAGSDGGVPEQLSALLASRGIASLALGYFGVPRTALPATLEGIRLDEIERAFAWIAAHPTLSRHRIMLCGTSRGGELALLLATRSPAVHGVLAWVPSSHVYSGFAGRVGEATPSAWASEAGPLPFVPEHDDRADAPWSEGPDAPRMRSLGAADHLRGGDFRAAEIPVERIRGPVLLIAGANDLLWPSGSYVRRIEDRLRRHGFSHRVEALVYPGAGHSIGPPVNPTTDLTLTVPAVAGAEPVTYALGGDPLLLARAQRDLWPRLLDFLHRGDDAPE